MSPTVNAVDSFMSSIHPITTPHASVCREQVTMMFLLLPLLSYRIIWQGAALEQRRVDLMARRSSVVSVSGPSNVWRIHPCSWLWSKPRSFLIFDPTARMEYGASCETTILLICPLFGFGVVGVGLASYIKHLAIGIIISAIGSEMHPKRKYSGSVVAHVHIFVTLNPILHRSKLRVPVIGAPEYSFVTVPGAPCDTGSCAYSKRFSEQQWNVERLDNAGSMRGYIWRRWYRAGRPAQYESRGPCPIMSQRTDSDRPPFERPCGPVPEQQRSMSESDSGTAWPTAACSALVKIEHFPSSDSDQA